MSKIITLDNYRSILGSNETAYNWDRISEYQKLSEEFIKEHHDKVNWDYISEYQTLSEEFIKEHHDKVNWNYISEYQKLSLEFIKALHDKVNWYNISSNQTLSEEFIIEFKDKVNWDYINKYQNLLEKFVEEFELDYYVSFVVHYCGKSNRPIIINKNDTKIIYIGCFEGTQEEAISRVSERYEDKEKSEYINKINLCFKGALKA